MPTITTWLWFDGQAEEPATFSTSLVDNGRGIDRPGEARPAPPVAEGHVEERSAATSSASSPGRRTLDYGRRKATPTITRGVVDASGGRRYRQRHEPSPG